MNFVRIGHLIALSLIVGTPLLVFAGQCVHTVESCEGWTDEYNGECCIDVMKHKQIAEDVTGSTTHKVGMGECGDFFERAPDGTPCEIDTQNWCGGRMSSQLGCGSGGT